MQTALKVILDNDGSYPSRLIMDEVAKRLDLSDYEKEVYQKTGYVRWQSMLHFNSITMVKAGWLKKHKGSWYITPEGEEALKLSPEEFYHKSSEKYHEWELSQTPAEEERQTAISDQQSLVTGYEQAESAAREAIKEQIKKMNPYEFQDLVAALFRGMGYYTPFIAPKGPDGGIDIIAYKDPVGAMPPRIRIQVKHRADSKVTRQEVAALNSDLQIEGCVGVLVSTGGFSTDATTEIRKVTNKHIEQIDLDAFVDLWEKFYDGILDDDKNLLRLERVYFLSPED